MTVSILGKRDSWDSCRGLGVEKAYNAISTWDNQENYVCQICVFTISLTIFAPKYTEISE
jgi:hypothetical protein